MSHQSLPEHPCNEKPSLNPSYYSSLFFIINHLQEDKTCWLLQRLLSLWSGRSFSRLLHETILLSDFFPWMIYQHIWSIFLTFGIDRQPDRQIDSRGIDRYKYKYRYKVYIINIYFIKYYQIVSFTQTKTSIFQSLAINKL